jgi:hypothetical protein
MVMLGQFPTPIHVAGGYKLWSVATLNEFDRKLADHSRTVRQLLANAHAAATDPHATERVVKEIQPPEAINGTKRSKPTIKVKRRMADQVEAR